MEKSNIITRIIKKFLSGRFSVETEEKVQRWIMKEENAEEKEKASLEYWNELDTEADSKTYSALERVNLRTGYNKEVKYRLEHIHQPCGNYWREVLHCTAKAVENGV